jgi:hypothetical protein
MAAQPLKTSWLSNHHTQKETCGHPATTLQETSLLAIQPTRKYLPTPMAITRPFFHLTEAAHGNPQQVHI